MPVELREDYEGKLLEVNLSGKLTKGDYAHFVPEVERLIQQHGKLRMLCTMRNFHGWTPGALWQDMKFDWKHFADIERVAFVGDRKWEHGMATFCKPFTKASLRYFDAANAEEARAWIRADMPEPVGHAGTAS